MERKERREVLTVLLLCVLWYAVSSSNNVIGKMVVTAFPHPMTMTMVQLLSITVYSGPLFRLWGVRRHYTDHISWRYYLRLVLPLACGKFLASVLTHVSIWRVPVSYAHTVKATMPLFTVILSRVLQGERQTCKVYLSLLPIVLGVGVATATELSFDTVGLAAALAATAGFSLQHIYSKQVLRDTGVHPLRLLHILGRLALMLFTPVWLLWEGWALLSDGPTTPVTSDTLMLLALDGALNWVQNIVAFSVLSLVTPLTYAVCNASKRVFVIALSLFVLGNAVTPANVMGMSMAILGVLYYNKAKYDAHKEATVLPFSGKSWGAQSGYRMLSNSSNSHAHSNGAPIFTDLQNSHNNNSFSYNSASNGNLGKNVLFA